MTASLYFVSSTQTSITVNASWQSSTPAYYVQFFVDADDGNRSSSIYSVGNTTNDNRNFTYGSGLSAGRQYKVYVRYYASNGSTQVGQSVQYFNTASPPPPAPGGVEIVNKTPAKNSISISWSSASYADRYVVEVRRGSASGTLDYSNYFVYSTSDTATGLLAGTLYHIKVYAINSVANGVASTTTTTTLPPMLPATPTGFQTYIPTDPKTQLGFTWNSVSGATGYSIELFRSSDGSFVNGVYNAASTSRVFTGLLTGISYDAKLYAVNVDGSSPVVWLYGVKTSGTRPNNFGWTLSKSKGRTLSIINGKIQNLVSYDEIFAFQNRINDFQTYKGIGTYPFSSRTKGQTFTTAIYIELKNSIDQMSPPIPTLPSDGGTLDILLLRLQSSLNSIT